MGIVFRMPLLNRKPKISDFHKFNVFNLKLKIKIHNSLYTFHTA